jgi:hypothetical protein
MLGKVGLFKIRLSSVTCLSCCKSYFSFQLGTNPKLEDIMLGLDRFS